MKLIDKIRRMFEKKVQVFLYHHILTKEEQKRQNITDESMCTNVDIFKKQCLSFKNKGYTFLKIEDIYNIQKENKKFPKKAICITFDDRIYRHRRKCFGIF